MGGDATNVDELDQRLRDLGVTSEQASSFLKQVPTEYLPDNPAAKETFGRLMAFQHAGADRHDMRALTGKSSEYNKHFTDEYKSHAQSALGKVKADDISRADFFKHEKQIGEAIRTSGHLNEGALDNFIKSDKAAQEMMRYGKTDAERRNIAASLYLGSKEGQKNHNLKRELKQQGFNIEKLKTTHLSHILISLDINHTRRYTVIYNLVGWTWHTLF